MFCAFEPVAPALRQRTAERKRREHSQDRLKVITSHLKGLRTKGQQQHDLDLGINMSKMSTSSSTSPTSSLFTDTTRDVCIVGISRTPHGSFGGSLSSLSATQLGSIAIRSALEKSKVSPDLVQEVFMGNVLQANCGQAPARQAALGAGIPDTCPCTTVNKVCASGMKSIMFGAQSIQLGYNEVVVCGGMESMSNCPYYAPSMRFGARMGDSPLVDGLVKDGLWDPYNSKHMGTCGDLCAVENGISREEQDKYAIQSYERAIHAEKSGYFRREIVPIPIKKKRTTVVVDTDEGISNVNFQKLKNLRPAFTPETGTVTAGNASTIADGASAVVLVSRQVTEKLNLDVLAVIRGFADAAQAPEKFPTTPALAIPKALSEAGLNLDNLGEDDYFEINEAFSVVSLANIKRLNLNPENVNVFGGAVSLGHPLGSSGCRIIVTLANVLHLRKGRYGIAGVCNGGGGASALVLERC